VPATFNRVAEVHDETGGLFERIAKKPNRLLVSFLGLAWDIGANRYSHLGRSFWVDGFRSACPLPRPKLSFERQLVNIRPFGM
jgi:hypothetical protein